jgi:enoyl-CoA hydratase
VKVAVSLTSLPPLATVTLDVNDRVAQLTLNRPEKRNSLDATMLSELVAALGWLADQPQVRVAVLRGAGPSFCAGFDVARQEPAGDADDAAAEYGGGGVADYLDLRRRTEQLFAVWTHPKPVIAAVHGYCLGAGSVLAALADITIVADDVKIGIPSLPLGGGMLTPTWVHLIGPKRAKEMAYRVGSTMSATQAEEWGFANQVSPADRLSEVALAFAEEIARTPLDLLVLKKAAINRMVDITGFTVAAQLGALTDALAHEARGLSAVRAAIKDRGVKQTVQDFNDGLLAT